LQVGIQVGHTEINKPFLTSAFSQPIEKLPPLTQARGDRPRSQAAAVCQPTGAVLEEVLVENL
jgi:hypothetical protein